MEALRLACIGIGNLVRCFEPFRPDQLTGTLNLLLQNDSVSNLWDCRYQITSVFAYRHL